MLWKTLEAISDVLLIGFPLNDCAALQSIAKGFSNFSHGRLNGCVLAVDGIIIRCRAPFHQSETENASTFCNRKGFYGIVIIAGCDATLKFHFFSGKSPGSTHDCIAWEYSSLYKSVFANKRLPSEYFAIGDDAFVYTNNFLTPFPGRNIGLFKDSFNYHLSSM